jgi:hypothetical protein
MNFKVGQILYITCTGCYWLVEIVELAGSRVECVGISGNLGYTCEGQTLTWTIEDLNIGGSYNCEIKFTP